MNHERNPYRNDQFDEALKASKSGILTKKAGTAKAAAIEAANRTKNTVIRVKVGKTAIAAAKSALKRIPGLPPMALVALDSEYADIAIGVILPLVLPIITDSTKVARLAQDINIAGGIAIADKLEFIDDFIAGFIADLGLTDTEE